MASFPGSRIRTFFVCGCFLIPLKLHAYDPPHAPEEAAGPAQACQVVMLRNGFTLRSMRHEVSGTATRLWLCSDAGAGYVDVPTDQIQNFEPGANESRVPAELARETSTRSMPPAKTPMNVLIASVAWRYQIDPDFVSSVVKNESGFNASALSPKGARGLMQLMPRTASQLGVENLFDPAANVEGGTKYLRGLLDLYEGDAVKALAAYNAGPQRVAQYGGVPPYPETRAYVARIISDFNRKKLQQRASLNPASEGK